MTHPYVPVESDELELRAGDFVYISPESLASSTDGWVEGISWLTGQTGHLPASFAERTAEMDAWTLHKKVALNYFGSGDSEGSVRGSEVERKEGEVRMGSETEGETEKGGSGEENGVEEAEDVVDVTYAEDEVIYKK